MKKSLLAAALALTATCAHAGDTAVLKVKASLTSNSCTPELSNDGVIDFGTVQVGDLSQTQTTQLGEKGLTLTITCPTPTKVGWSIADNRTDSCKHRNRLKPEGAERHVKRRRTARQHDDLWPWQNARWQEYRCLFHLYQHG